MACRQGRLVTAAWLTVAALSSCDRAAPPKGSVAGSKPPAASSAPGPMASAAPPSGGASALPDAAAPTWNGKWPLPQDCNIQLCKTPAGGPGVTCGGPCFNPCPKGMAPEHEGMFCARTCRSQAECPGGTCTPDGVCDRWPSRPSCDDYEMCQTPSGEAGTRCKPRDRCVPVCKKGLVLYGGTHCAKPCRGDADCPGGSCSEEVCGPLCTSEGCPYPWE